MGTSISDLSMIIVVHYSILIKISDDDTSTHSIKSMAKHRAQGGIIFTKLLLLILEQYHKNLEQD
jgi:hypothetical protein